MAYPPTQRIVNAVTFAATLFFNFSGVLNITGDPSSSGDDHEHKTPRVQVWVQPATYAFSIWFVIYSLVLGFVVYGLVPGTYAQHATGFFSNAANLIDRRIGGLFLLSSVFNVTWLIVAGNYHNFSVLLIVITLMTVTVGAIFHRTHPRVNYYGQPEGASGEREPLINAAISAIAAASEEANAAVNAIVEPVDSALTTLFVKVPFAMYYGWLICATTVSVFIAFLPIDDERPFATILIARLTFVVLGSIASGVSTHFRDLIVPGVLIWALTSIPYSEAVKSHPGVEADRLVCTALTIAALTFIASFVTFFLPSRFARWIYRASHAAFVVAFVVVFFY